MESPLPKRTHQSPDIVPASPLKWQRNIRNTCSLNSYYGLIIFTLIREVRYIDLMYAVHTYNGTSQLFIHDHENKVESCGTCRLPHGIGAGRTSFTIKARECETYDTAPSTLHGPYSRNPCMAEHVTTSRNIYHGRRDVPT